jgi:hypothetical protein
VVLQSLERSLEIIDIDAQVRPIQGHAAGELLAHHFEADHQVGHHGLAGRGLLLVADARAGAPGQEFGVFGDVPDELENLVRLERQDLLFSMDFHSAAGLAFSRAVRSRAKSSPA